MAKEITVTLSGEATKDVIELLRSERSRLAEGLTRMANLPHSPERVKGFIKYESKLYRIRETIKALDAARKE